MAGKLSLSFVLEAIDRATAPIRKVQERIAKLEEPLRKLNSWMGRMGAASHFGRVQARFNDMTQSAGNLFSAATRVAGAFIGIGAAAGGAFYGFRRLADSVDRIADQAAKLKVPIEDLQRLQYAAKQSGSDAEEMGSALEYLAKRMAEARSGSQEAQTWFSRVGVSMADLGNMNTIQVWERIGDKFNEVGDAGGNVELKLKALEALTGRSSTGLVELANRGAAGMRKLYEEADKTGGVVSGKTAEAFGDFNDKLGQTETSIFGLFTAVGAKLLPVLSPLVERLGRWIERNRELIATRVAAFVERIIPKIPAFAESVEKLVTALAKAVGWADKFAQAIGGWENVLKVVAALMAGSALQALWGFGSALIALNGALALTPFGWFVGGVALLAGGAYLLIKHWDKVVAVFEKVKAAIGGALGLSEEAGEKLPNGVGAAPRPSAIAPRGFGAPYADREGLGKGQLHITIDADGRPRVSSLSSGPGSLIDFSIDSSYLGPAMAN